MRRLALFVLLFAAASLAQAAFTISRTSSATFYTDTSVTPNITCNYESFSITSSSAVTDAWARASGFSGVLGLGGNDDGIQNLGAFSAGQTKYAFFYVCSSFTGNTSSGAFDVAVYDRNPALAGAATLGGPSNFSFTVDNTLIQAATNTVTTIFAGPNPATIGGIVTMTVEGDTGTIGSNPGPNGPLSFTPAAYASWRADAYELFATNISLSGGNSGSYDNQLVIPSLGASSTTHYVATYYFRAMGGTTSTTELSPLVDIASGTQIKHTDTTKGAYGSGLLPIEPASNSLLLTKLVSAATLPAQGGTVTYTLRLSNSSGSAISVDDFVDTLPAGAAYVNNSSTFAGVAIANPYASGQTLTWNAPFSVPAGGTADLVFQATLPPTPSLYTNSAVAHVGSTVIDATYSTSDNVPATAATRVLAAPTVAKSFSPVATAVNSAATLTLTFTNPNTATALTGLAIADTYPAGLVNAATPNAATTCPGATITGGVAGGNTVGLSAGSLAASGSCTLSISVTSAAGATYANTTGTVSSTNGGVGATASASVTFTTKPTLAKTFTPAVVPLGTTSRVAITVTNNNTVSLTALAFGDTLPAGMAVAATPNVSNTCGGTVTGATSGSTTVSLSGGGIALPALTCQLAFDVIASPAGVYANTTSGASSTETGAAGPASNTANLTVMSAPTVSKSFSVASMGRGQAATLTITLGNTNATDITGSAFTDTYPANLVNAATPAAATTCAGGTVTAAPGGGSVALSGATVPANGSCTVTVNVTSSTAATYANNIAAGGVTAANAPASTAAASAQIIVNNTPTITKSFSTNLANGITTMTLVITNNASAGGVTSLAFTDNFPAGLVVSSSPALANSCGGTVTGATSGSTSIGLSGGAIANPGATCQLSVSVISNLQGVYNNTTGGVSSNLGTGAPSNTATYIAAGLAKSFSPNTTGVGDTSRLTLTLSNPSPTTALTGVTFTDNFPSNMTTTASPSVANTCGGTVTGGGANVNNIGLTGGSLAPGASCSISVNVMATAVASYYNQTGNVITSQGTGVNGADTLYITARPTLVKSFSPATITMGSSSTLSITVENNNGSSAISNVAFSDAFPSGMVVAAAPALTNTCGGTVGGATAGSTSINLSGGALAANAKCTITIAVTATAAGSYSNQTSGATSTETGATPGPRSNIAVLAVNLPAPTVAKSFATSPVGINTDTAMTITLTNPSAIAITGVNFTDTYPSGLVNSGTPGLTSTCSGSATAAAGGTSLALVGGTIPASGSCAITVNVRAASPNTYVNTTGAVTAANANSGASASATLVVLAPLTVTKSFTASTVGPNVSTVMTIRLANPNSTAVTGVAFTDSYPAGLANTATPAGATTCAGGAVTAAASGTSVSFSGGTVPASGNCTITVNVAAAAAGSYTNTLAAGAVTSANAGSNSAAGSATLTVLTPLTVTKAFSPASIGTGDTSVMTITLTNGNATTVTGIALTDTYPAGLVNTAAANPQSTCSASPTAANNGGSVALSGGSVPANASCTVTVNVTSAAAGSYLNSTGPITTTNAGTAAAGTGTLTVLAHPAIAKAFSPAQVPVNATSTLTFTLTNANAVAITGAGFTDNYPANLQNAATPAASSTCAGASITAAAGGNSLAVTGATIPANGSCTVQVTVTPTATGSFANTLAAGALTSANAGASTGPASATLTAQGAPTAAKAFTPSTIATNGTSVLTITVTNPNTSSLTGVTFTDNYPAGLANTGTPAAAIGGAGCSGTVSASPGGASVALSGGVVPASSSCTITVNVTASTPGSYLNSTGAIATANAGSAAAATATLRVFTAPTVTKSFAPTFIPTGGSSTLTIAVTNPAANPADLTGAAISDAYPAGLTNIAAGSIACSAGSATLTGGVNGGAAVGFTNATIPPGATCTITQSVTTTANVTNTTGTATSNEAPAGTAASASLATSTAPSVAKAFSPDTVALGGTSTITFTITNPNPVALTGGAFTDTLSGMQIDATGAAGGTCAGAGGNTFTTGQASLAFSGIGVPASQACTVTVVVRGTAVGAQPNTASAFSSNQAPASAASNTATLTVTATAPTIAKAFSVSPIDPGAISTLTITVSNGNASAIAITSVTDTLPAGMTVASTPNIANSCAGGTVTNTSGSVTLTGGSVPANGACAFSIDVTSSAAGASLVNTIPAGALTTNAGSNAVAASATLNVRPAADLSITKTTAATVASGAALTYTIVVSNAGPSPASGAQLTDNVPAAVTGVAASCGSPTGGAACGAVNVSGNAVTSTITTLPAGSSVTFTITGTAPAAGTFTNSASVVTPAGVVDPTDPGRTGAGNNTASANTTVVAPDLRVTKSHTGSFSA
ncbi:MAG TPA: hypothetical protein VFP44_05380, partial [Usitatibacter sp.]|nr:hypothetical protein [Usitatibacter sp.]